MEKITELRVVKIDKEVFTMVKKSADRTVSSLYCPAFMRCGNSPYGSNRLAGKDAHKDNGENITSSYISFTP